MLLSMQQRQKNLDTVIEYGKPLSGPVGLYMVKIPWKTMALGTIQVDYNLPERFD
jgi:threonyl-tRNA synthetase